MCIDTACNKYNDVETRLLIESNHNKDGSNNSNIYNNIKNNISITSQWNKNVKIVIQRFQIKCVSRSIRSQTKITRNSINSKMKQVSYRIFQFLVASDLTIHLQWYYFTRMTRILLIVRYIITQCDNARDNPNLCLLFVNLPLVIDGCCVSVIYFFLVCHPFEFILSFFSKNIRSIKHTSTSKWIKNGKFLFFMATKKAQIW